MQQPEAPKTELRVQCNGKPANGEFPATRGCGNVFPYEGNISTRMLNKHKGIIRAELRCPNCFTSYAVGYSSNKMKSLQKDVKTYMLREEENKEIIEELQQAIKEEQTALRKKYGV